MTPTSAQSFSVWLLKEHPALFYAIAKQQQPSLGAFSDILSNVGGAFSSAVSSVSNWVTNPQNVQSLTKLASTYFTAQAAKSNANVQLAVLTTQAARAQAGQTAAPITYTYNDQGQPVPVYTGNTAIPALGTQVALPSGQLGYPISSQSLQSLAPTFLQKYGLYLGIGGALLVVAFVALR